MKTVSSQRLLLLLLAVINFANLCVGGDEGIYQRNSIPVFGVGDILKLDAAETLIKLN